MRFSIGPEKVPNNDEIRNFLLSQIKPLRGEGGKRRTIEQTWRLGQKY